MQFLRSAFLACLGLGLLFGQPLAARMLVIGTISDEPIKETRIFLPFAGHLADALQDQGITGSGVVIARDIPHMAELLSTGVVDIYIDSPLVSLAVRGRCGSRLLARRWKKGIAEYSSVIFTRRGSGVRSLQDLKGRVVAFEEAFSSSGYILPHLAFSEQALPLVPLDSPRSARPENSTGFVFSGDDENTLEWVLRGLVDAGAMSLDTLKAHVNGDLADLEIVMQTRAIPRHVVSVAPSVSAEFALSLAAVLAGLDQSAEGRSVLEDFERTAKFDSIPEQTLELLDRFQEPVATLIGGD